MKLLSIEVKKHRRFALPAEPGGDKEHCQQRPANSTAPVTEQAAGQTHPVRRLVNHMQGDTVVVAAAGSGEQSGEQGNAGDHNHQNL